VTLVDTSSWVHFFRRDGDPEVKSRVQNLLNEGSAVICPVILAELWMGAGSEKDRNDVRRLKEAVLSLEIEGASLGSMRSIGGSLLPSWNAGPNGGSHHCRLCFCFRSGHRSFGQTLSHPGKAPRVFARLATLDFGAEGAEALLDPAEPAIDLADIADLRFSFRAKSGNE